MADDFQFPIPPRRRHSDGVATITDAVGDLRCAFGKWHRRHRAKLSLALSAACLVALCALWYVALLLIASFFGYDLQP